MRFYLGLSSVYSVLATILIAVLGYQNYQFKDRGDSEPAKLDLDDVSQVSVGYAPTLGPENAPIEIVLFSEFECPFCAQSEATINQLMARFPGQIKVGFKHLPQIMHENAKPAAAAAMAAHMQGRFWDMSSALFQNRRDLTAETYVSLAGQLGLDLKQFESDMAGEKWRDYIEEDIEEARALAVGGTPTYFVNGIRVIGNNFKHLNQAVEHCLQNMS